MAELLETQDDYQQDESTVDITQEAQQTIEEPQEQTAQAAPAEESIPPKYRGKSIDEIVKMHQEAEKLIGRQAQEVGEVRKLADELIKRQLDTKQEVTAAKEDEIDYFDDPKKAVALAVEKHPAIQEAKEQALQLKQIQTLNRLKEEFPDFQQTVEDPSFAEWIKASPVRVRLYAAADANFDYEAAAELLSTWNYVKPKAVQQTSVTSQPEVKAAQKAAVKSATVDVGSNASSPSSSKIYRRADIIRLQLEDYDRYVEMQPEIMAAYAEGRVR